MLHVEYRSMVYTTTRVITYTYDPLYRLTGADYSSGESFTYAYDAAGNRTEQVRTLTATTVISYVYDAANRLDLFYTGGSPRDERKIGSTWSPSALPWPATGRPGDAPGRHLISQSPGQR